MIQLKKIMFAFIALLLVSSLTSALTVSSVTTQPLAPGKQTSVSIVVENNQDNDVTDVSFSLQLSGLPFSVIGSSQDSVNEIEDDEEEQFSFTLKAFQDIKAGDYNIPYTLMYTDEKLSKEQKGSFGIAVIAQPELTVTLTTETPVQNKQGKINIKIVNKGLADAKFVTIKIAASGLTLLSEDEIYIGNINSDDFETATFAALFTKTNPSVLATIEYTDFTNQKQLLTKTLPISVYTEEKALELGIIQKNNLPLYIGLVVLLIVVWFIYRAFRKRQRLKRSQSG
ncbi:MAG TPA: CARDB domain-containing protein [Candidatus Nanoarchaeia archaeon]|nr:CARDB domain-containing protein [Candidatus Nanoarchaeia archaeon]